MYTVPKLDDYSPAALDRAVAELFAALDSETGELQTEADWKTFRDRWMARKNGILTQVNDFWLKAAPTEAKRAVGDHVNRLKLRVAEKVQLAEVQVKDPETARLTRERLIDAKDLTDIGTIIGEARATAGQKQKLAAERIDITLPGVRRPIGVKHPVLRVQDEIVAVFKAMGYSVGEGPEVETD